MALEIIPKVGKGSPFPENLAFHGVDASAPAQTKDISGVVASNQGPAFTPAGIVPGQ